MREGGAKAACLRGSDVEALPLAAPHVTDEGVGAGEAFGAVPGAVLRVHLRGIVEHVVARLEEAQQVQVRVEVQALRKHVSQLGHAFGRRHLAVVLARALPVKSHVPRARLGEDAEVVGQLHDGNRAPRRQLLVTKQRTVWLTAATEEAPHLLVRQGGDATLLGDRLEHVRVELMDDLGLLGRVQLRLDARQLLLEHTAAHPGQTFSGSGSSRWRSHVRPQTATGSARAQPPRATQASQRHNSPVVGRRDVGYSRREGDDGGLAPAAAQRLCLHQLGAHLREGARQHALHVQRLRLEPLLDLVRHICALQLLHGGAQGRPWSDRQAALRRMRARSRTHPDRIGRALGGRALGAPQGRGAAGAGPAALPKDARLRAGGILARLAVEAERRKAFHARPGARRPKLVVEAVAGAETVVRERGAELAGKALHVVGLALCS
eukprot:scaffold1054_cov366-Prasinococcus_capsulatus_cf.AAC.14